MELAGLSLCLNLLEPQAGLCHYLLDLAGLRINLLTEAGLCLCINLLGLADTVAPQVGLRLNLLELAQQAGLRSDLCR